MAAATAASILGATAAVGSAVAQNKAAKDAQKGQERQTEAAQQFTQEQQEQGRADVQNLFPQAFDRTTQGFQQAIDVFGQSVPQQAQAFQQGNVAAQQTLEAGLPQFQRALLGLPTDFGAITRARGAPVQFDTGFLQQQLGGQGAQAPNFQTPQTESQRQAEININQTDAEITRLYQELLGRDPDPSGLQYSRTIAAPSGLVSPGGLRRLRDQIMGSEAFRNRQQGGV